MSEEVRCTPGLRYATLRWIWGRPGPAGGWQLRLPDADAEQVLRPPRRGMPPHEVASWLEEVLAAHSWRQHSPVRWPLSPAADRDRDPRSACRGGHRHRGADDVLTSRTTGVPPGSTSPRCSSAARIRAPDQGRRGAGAFGDRRRAAPRGACTASRTGEGDRPGGPCALNHPPETTRSKGRLHAASPPAAHHPYPRRRAAAARSGPGGPGFKRSYGADGRWRGPPLLSPSMTCWTVAPGASCSPAPI
ncbi:hypothetical protein Sros_4733 [Streptosporangium roseum DSM 43021]|uniref:Uncharacterized protein n=1 Tax=Streptosporangium roseum (strain ATCC 12428 / DSM 43021 / JCM 3005 / KCTC 9067 / NCIMB 10171 / NRRL 2505 / NI 9100) TaxID=479432 RepID=D2B550_STRRD|nr:hypothetical protein Sros_4733 [Streptosporangium roseum DSM 43021]